MDDIERGSVNIRSICWDQNFGKVKKKGTVDRPKSTYFLHNGNTTAPLFIANLHLQNSEHGTLVTTFTKTAQTGSGRTVPAGSFCFKIVNATPGTSKPGTAKILIEKVVETATSLPEGTLITI